MPSMTLTSGTPSVTQGPFAVAPSHMYVYRVPRNARVIVELSPDGTSFAPVVNGDLLPDIIDEPGVFPVPSHTNVYLRLTASGMAAGDAPITVDFVAGGLVV